MYVEPLIVRSERFVCTNQILVKLFVKNLES
jgi:hypothetical protein